MGAASKPPGLTLAWLLVPPVVLVIVVGLAIFFLAAEGSFHAAQIEICRSGVEPCQNQVDVDVGQEVALDIILRNAQDTDVVGWEAHLVVTDDSVIDLIGVIPHSGIVTGEPVDSGNGVPVQEKGDGLALGDAVRLGEDAPGSDVAQYFTWENQYDSQSSKIDYTVTLLLFDPADAAQRVVPFSDDPGLVLGRITVRGVAQGITQIVASPQSSTDEGPFNIVMLTGDGELAYLPPIGFAEPLVTINVGEGPGPFEGELTLTLNGPGWNLINIPLVPDVGDTPGEIFSDLAFFKIFGWDAAGQNYFPVEWDDTLEFGARGYWIFVDGDYQTTLIGAPLRQVETELLEQWNLVGGPFLEDGEVGVSTTDPAGAVLSTLFYWDAESRRYTRTVRLCMPRVAGYLPMNPPHSP